MGVRLTSIQFHTGHAGDPTLPLVRVRIPGINEVDPVDLPEWSAGRSRIAKDAPAAFCLSLLNGRAPQIRIRLDRDALGPETLYLRALEPSGANLLGRVGMPDGLAVDFAEAANVIVVADLTEAQLDRVAIHDDTWDWQWRTDTSEPWQDLVRTRHRIMVGLAPPLTDPWSATVLPWTDVFEVAAGWAAGATTLDGAARRITRAVFSLGETSADHPQFVYDPAGSFADGNFDCAGFLAAIAADDHSEEFPTVLACTDASSIVSTFANVLGCALLQVQINVDGQITTNPVRCVGQAEFCSRQFIFHEVAAKGAAQGVWDACLMVDSDVDPALLPFAGFNAAGVPMQLYLERFLSSGSLGLKPGAAVIDGGNRPLGPLKSGVARGFVTPPEEPIPAGGNWFYWNLQVPATLLAPLVEVNRFPPQVPAPGLPCYDAIWTLQDSLQPKIRVQIESFFSIAAARLALEARRHSVAEPMTPRAIGNIGYASLSGATIFFVRGSLLVALRCAGATRQPVTPFAHKVDAFLSEPVAPQGFAMVPGVGAVDLGKLLETTDAAGNPVWYRVFTETGEVRVLDNEPVYLARQRGPQTVAVMTYSPSGSPTPSQYHFDLQ